MNNVVQLVLGLLVLIITITVILSVRAGVETVRRNRR